MINLKFIQLKEFNAWIHWLTRMFAECEKEQKGIFHFPFHFNFEKVHQILIFPFHNHHAHLFPQTVSLSLFLISIKCLGMIERRVKKNEKHIKIYAHTICTLTKINFISLLFLCVYIFFIEKLFEAFFS